MLGNWFSLVIQLKWQYVKMWKCTVNFLLVSVEIKIEFSISVICWKDTCSKYFFFSDKDKYSLFDPSCRWFWIRITKIHVERIHKNTIMSDEHIVSSQSSMQCLPTRLPIIILQRAEEQLPAVREVMVGAVCLCADRIIISSILGICVA